MGLDELAARLDHIAHEGREDILRVVDVPKLDSQQQARLWIERGLPELTGVHLAEPLVTSDRHPLATQFEDTIMPDGRKHTGTGPPPDLDTTG